mgnify:CR=1 FL=1
MSNKIKDIVEELTLPIVEKYSFELVDVEFVKEGRNWYLRVYIDKPGGITIDDCQKVNEELGDELDRVDPIPHSYILEVSSPGIDRPLKKQRDFERAIGENIQVKLFRPVDNKKTYEGKLIDFKDDKLIIKLDDDKIMEFDRQDVALARKTIKF